MIEERTEKLPDGYEIQVIAGSFDGYRLADTKVKNIRVVKGQDNTIRFNYEEDRASVTYTITYEEKSGRIIAGKYEFEGTSGSTVTARAREFPGYKLLSSATETITLVEGKENNIVFTYEGSGQPSEHAKMGVIEVNLYDKVNKKNIDVYNLHGIVGTSIKEVGVEISGYKLLDTAFKEGIIGQTKSLSFNYQPIGTVVKPGDTTKPTNPGGGNTSGGGLGGNNILNPNTNNNNNYYGGIRDQQTNITLEKSTHKAYIQGYEDNTIRPNNRISREEVATIFYRILSDNSKYALETENHGFFDIEGNRWSRKSIATLAAGKIINGYEDGSFRPGNNITRGEVATIVSKFKNDNEKSSTGTPFYDINDHWAYGSIMYASSQGWIRGYEDGTFRPDDYITRAELITLVNNVLGRKTNVENMLEGKIEYGDLLPSEWYYEAIQEAINSHEYIIQNGLEYWTNLI